MNSRKAFIFSLDSFIAFTLTLAALYALVFFSTVPSAYYASLMQANYLAKDTLLALATTAYENEEFEGTYLDYIVSVERENEPGERISREEFHPARTYIGALIPPQFGYKIETHDDEVGGWVEIYNTAWDDGSENKKEYHKLKATAQSLYLIVKTARDPGESPYGYITCTGGYTVCDLPLPYEYEAGEAELSLVRLTVYT